MKNELTYAEKKSLISQEAVIEKTKSSFLECGLALATIRDAKLYRDKYSTFEKYCKEKHQWTRDRVYKLIESAQVKSALPRNVENFIQNPGQASALADVPERLREEVLKEVAASGKVTAARINEASKPKQAVDGEGHPITEDMLPDWQRAEDCARLIQSISLVKVTLETGLENGDVIFAELTNGTVASLKCIYSDIKRILPHAVCPTCQGHNRKKCSLCKGRGWISAFLWKNAVPKETKELRAKWLK